jgi:hypothetical protein
MGTASLESVRTSARIWFISTMTHPLPSPTQAISTFHPRERHILSRHHLQPTRFLRRTNHPCPIWPEYAGLHWTLTICGPRHSLVSSLDFWAHANRWKSSLPLKPIAEAEICFTTNPRTDGMISGATSNVMSPKQRGNVRRKVHSLLHITVVISDDTRESVEMMVEGSSTSSL